MKRIDISSWKKFKIGDLFDLTTSSWLNLWKLEINKRKWENCYEFIWRTKENYWVQGYLQKQGNCEPNEENVISVSQIGSVHAQIRYNKWYSSQNIFILQPKKEFGLSLLNHFLITVINKILQKYDSAYTSYPTLKSLKEDMLSLPATPSWDPDFEYMENYIKELETRESILLILSSLKKIEKNRIDISKWKKFKIGDLFEVQRWNISDQKTIQESDKKDCVFVAQNEKDNGFVCYVEPNNNKIFNPSIIIWRQTWIIYYQPKKFITTDWVLILIWKNNTLSSLVSLFLVSVLKKYFINSWYSNPISAKQVSDLEIYLPVTSDNQIDYNYMENYIKNIQAKEIEIMNFFK